MYSDNQKNYVGPIAVIVAVLVFGGIIAGRSLLAYLQNSGAAPQRIGTESGTVDGQNAISIINLKMIDNEIGTLEISIRRRI